MPVRQPAQHVLHVLFQPMDSRNSRALPCSHARDARDLHELAVVDATVAVLVEGLHQIVDAGAGEANVQIAEPSAELFPRDASWIDTVPGLAAVRP
eukprot:scaffold7341_cov229-Pinguiococcus_pyrenoidosus.AAC.12